MAARELSRAGHQSRRQGDTVSIIGRVYLDPGDHHSGRYDPPRRCVVITGWELGSWRRNVRVRYLDDGTVAVIPFNRRLRRIRTTKETAP